MGNETSCPICGKPVGESGLNGLCPECLLKAGFPTGTEPGTGGAGGSRFVAPSVEEVRKLFPHLEVIELIGRGGMGAVYKARQKELDRLVALKILPPGIGDDRAFADRFVREAKALAKLNHPNIVTLYEFDHADGLFYFMMEFVDGVNLRQLLQAGRLAPREALAIVPQICDALQYAHDHGVVHRDIKPENILLDRKGHVKVADFGLARLMGIEREIPTVEGGQVASASVSLTEAGKVMGTPRYMAPEQKDRPAEVDHRADIYSLGVVFYQMLTGELPGKRIEAPSKKFHLDVRLDEVVLRALEKEPALRYQQADQFKTQIETIASASPTKVGRTAGALSPANTFLAYVALCFGGLSGVLGFLTFFSMPRPPASLVWSILAAALLGVFLAIPSRKSRAGKSAIICGGINATIWCIVMLAANVIPNHHGPWPSAPFREAVISDAFDLDTGTSRDSSDVTQRNSSTDAAFPRWDWLVSSANGIAWMRKSGADLLAVKDGLTGYAAIVHLERSSDWKNVTFQELTNRLQFSPLGLFGFLNEVDSYAFRTQEGSVGTLRYAGRSENPPGVKIRYRLVGRIAAERPEPPSPQMVPVREIRDTSVQEWFRRIASEYDGTHGPFAAMRALIAKAKESESVRDEIIRTASEIIDEPIQADGKRWQCCYVLSGIGDKRGLPALKRTLQDKNEVVRGVAACALGAFDDSEARSALEDATRTEKSPAVLEWIRKSLDGQFRNK